MLRKQHKIKIMLYLHLISFDKEDPPMGPCRNILICVCTNPSSQSSSTCISSVYSHHIFPQISFLDFSAWLNLHRSTWKVNNQPIATYRRYTNCSDLNQKGALSPPKKSTTFLWRIYEFSQNISMACPTYLKHETFIKYFIKHVKQKFNYEISNMKYEMFIEYWNGA